MTPENLQYDYLLGMDATDTFYWFPPSFDEWNAIRLQTGHEPGTFNEYLIAIEPGFNRARKQDND